MLIEPKTPENFISKDHLGGTSLEGDPQSWSPSLWDFLLKEFCIRNMLDVGCGCGYTQNYFAEKGTLSIGIDGYKVCLDNHVMKNPQYYYLHDLVNGPIYIDKFDLVWCCELAEHLEKQYEQNVLSTLKVNCRDILAFCAAPKDWPGYHHVNCENPEYWIAALEKYGFIYRDKLTDYAKSLCEPANYFKRSGLIFTL